MITVPEKYKHLLKEDKPTREYREAVVRDIIKEADGRPIKLSEFNIAVGNVPTSGSMSEFIRQLISQGRITRRTVFIGGGQKGGVARSTVYTWHDTPVKVAPKPPQYKSRPEDGEPVIVVPGRKDTASVIERVKQYVQSHEGEIISTKKWSRITGLTESVAQQFISKKLVHGGLLSKKVKSNGLRPGDIGYGRGWGFTYEWVGDQAAPAAAPAAAAQEKPAARRGQPSPFGTAELRNIFVEWVDTTSDPQLILGAAKFRQYIEKQLEYTNVVEGQKTAQDRAPIEPQEEDGPK